MKGTIILIACLLAMVLMVTFTEGKPVAKNHEEATEDPEPDTNDYEPEDHEVNEESEKESEDEHSGSSGHLSDDLKKEKDQKGVCPETESYIHYTNEGQLTGAVRCWDTISNPGRIKWNRNQVYRKNPNDCDIGSALTVGFSTKIMLERLKNRFGEKIRPYEFNTDKGGIKNWLCKQAGHYPLPGPPFPGPYPGAGPEPYPEHEHYPEFPGPYPHQHLKKYKKGDKGKKEKKLSDEEKEKENDKHD